MIEETAKNPRALKTMRYSPVALIFKHDSRGFQHGQDDD
jgi:hypothetical protein